MSEKDKYVQLDEEKNNTQSDAVPIKIKSLDGNVRDVQANINHTIQQFKQEYYQNELQMNKLIKLIYRGRLLKDDETILSLNLPPNTFIHVSIQNNPNAPEPSKPAVADTNSEQQQQANNDNNQPDFAQNQQLQNDLRTILNQQQNNNNIPPSHQEIPIQLTQEQQEMYERNKRIQFTLGFIMGLLFGYYGLLFVIICTLSSHQKYGAFAGFVARILYILLFASYQPDQQGSSNQQSNIVSSTTQAPSGEGYLIGFMNLDFSVSMIQYFMGYLF